MVPTDPASESTVARHRRRPPRRFSSRSSRGAEPTIIAIGTGRTLRAAVEQMPRMICPQHKLVSLVGNISTEGSASFFDVLARLSDLTQAPHYPDAAAGRASASRDEREQLLRLEPVRRVLELAAERRPRRWSASGGWTTARSSIVDGFISADELAEMRRLGAVGEVTGWAFDAAGRIIDGGTNDRLTSVPREVPPERLVVGVAQGTGKVLPIHAALRGRG